MLDSWNPLGGLGGDQLQPGVEDGGTPTEVVVGEHWRRGIPSPHSFTESSGRSGW